MLEQEIANNNQLCIDKIGGLYVQMGALQSRMKDVNHHLQAIMAKLYVGPSTLVTPDMGVLGTQPSMESFGMFAPSCRVPLGINPTTIVIPNQLGHFKTPKLDLSSFERDNSRHWIQKTNFFFTFNPILKNWKVLFASLNLQGWTESWYHGLLDCVILNSWEDFTEALHNRFKDDAFENGVGEFNNIIQLSLVDEYQTHF